MRHSPRSVHRHLPSSLRGLLFLALLGLAGCQIGTTTPVPAADQIYVLDAGGIIFQPRSQGISALDVRTGSVIWHHVYPDTGLVLPRFAIWPFESGGTVYAGYDTRRANLEALDAASGVTLWRHVASAVELAGPPAVGAGGVYLTSRIQHLHDAGIAAASGLVEALDARGGADIWHVSVDGVPSPPTLADGRVIVTVFREPAATWHVLALDAVSGRQVWNYESPLSLYGGVMLPDAAVPAAASHAVLVRALERGPNGLATTAVLTLDGRDGTLLWRYQPGGTINVPALAGSRVCLTSTIGTADGASTVVAMLDTATGRAIWSETMVGGASGCALSPDSVYLGQLRPGGAGGEFALDAASGNVRWNVALAPILTLGPPVVADGAVSTLIIRYSGATPNVAVAVLRVSDGHLLWRRDQGIVRTMAEPVLGFALDVTSGILVVTNGDFNAESAYSLRDGALLWQH